MFRALAAALLIAFAALPARAAWYMADRVQMTVTAESSTLFTVGSASTGYIAIGASNGDEVGYIVADGAGNWEEGYGAYTTSGTTVGRLATPIASSNAGAQVASWTGTPTISIVPMSVLSRAPLPAMSGLNASRQWGPAVWGIPSFTSGIALTAGSMYCIPIPINQWFSSYTASFYLATAFSGTSTVALGLYTDQGGQPFTLIGSAAAAINTGTSATTGINTTTSIATGAPRPPSTYWGCVLPLTNSPSIARYTASATAMAQNASGYAALTATVENFEGWILSGQSSLPTTITQSSLIENVATGPQQMTVATSF
jgi:hypothetical protein